MIRIFVPQLIIFLEEFDLSFLYDTSCINSLALYEVEIAMSNQLHYTLLDRVEVQVLVNEKFRKL